LYHLSVPIRTPWVSDLPGSFLALSIWILGSFVLRWILQSTVGGTSIYGPLAAPIAVLMWLYMTAIAVLIGAALNAVVDRLWPHKAHVTEVKKETPEPESEPAEAEAEVEPVMKAEPEQHHEHPNPLTPVESDDHAEAARKLEEFAEQPRKTGPAVRTGLGKKAVHKAAKKSGETVPDEPGRKAAKVGKPGAQGDPDDLG
ncbi:YihY/virulence factor BrkB family protein, partial [Kribbella sp.]|uniref:YihY/virulence factor BrkB family protein n=1 Tax=Kribbella sp. TaxID=1871183 RepID=UPI002D34BEDB